MSHRARAEALAKERDAQKAAADAMADAHDIVKRERDVARERAAAAERERDTLRALLERCATVFRAGKMFPEHESNLLTDITAVLHQPKEQP